MKLVKETLKWLEEGGQTWKELFNHVQRVENLTLKHNHEVESRDDQPTKMKKVKKKKNLLIMSTLTLMFSCLLGNIIFIGSIQVLHSQINERNNSFSMKVHFLFFLLQETGVGGLLAC